MRIALVADTFSVEKGTGIARYSQEMLSGLRSKGLFVEPIAPEPPAMPLGLAINHALKMPYLVRSKAARFDVIHATSPITALAFPVISSPKIVTYHDLLSLLCRNTSTASYTRLLAPLFLRIGRYADRIIANSIQTKEEVVTHLGIPAEKITVTLWGISEIFKPQRKGQRDGYAIGYVGAFNRRKGLPYLIRAIDVLKLRHPELPLKLVICGRKDHEYARLVQLISELSLSHYVNFRGSLTDRELVEAYNSFDVFVLPSEWEGFGLPILEAQRCGVPVLIRADGHIPPEVSKCCLKASSEEDMADKIYELLTNAILRQSRIEEGLEYSQQFTWERTVRQTLEVYEAALSH
jgi:glycosyltransferase involved in cell wall biosynthesis